VERPVLTRPRARASSRSQIAAATALAAAALALGTGLAGCLRGTSFACASDVDCTGSVPGHCEPVGFCSFPDGSCGAGGSRFGDLSGDYAGKCVGEIGPDGGIDAPGDGLDGPTAGCPATYAALPGIATHVYRGVPAAGTWTAQRSTCTDEGGYLAEPADAAELAAVNLLAGAIAIWVGLTDQDLEGTFVTGRGAAPLFEPMLPWATGEPDDAPQGGADCVFSSATGKYADDRCSTIRRAVCECEP
jgi:hypothetical protein